jgi:hypothetical protein
MRARAIRAEQIVRDRLAPAFNLLGMNRLLLKRALQCPQDVCIELTSACDADCIMCPRRSMSRRQGPMEFGLFRKVVDEAVEIGAPSLSLNGYGEISTLKNYREYLAYIRGKSRDITISVNTNGMRMNEQMARDYIEFGVNVVNITIDGARAETFETIRKYLKLEQVERNVRQLITMRNQMKKTQPMVSVGMIVMEQNRPEIDEFRKKWEGVADKLLFSGLANRAGSVQWVQIDQAADWTKTPCFYLWSQLPIWNDGSAALCCDDWNAEDAIGNAANATLSEIWTGQERRRLRQLHAEGRGDEIPACKACQRPHRGPEWFHGLHAPRTH